MTKCTVGVTLFMCMIVLNTQSVHGIDCYQCTSSTDSGCGENPDGANLIVAGKVASGCSACLKTFTALGTIWSSVQRSCGYAAVDDCENILGYGSCSCTTSFCNGGTTTSGGVILIIVSVLVAAHNLLSQ